MALSRDFLDQLEAKGLPDDAKKRLSAMKLDETSLAIAETMTLLGEAAKGDGGFPEGFGEGLAELLGVQATVLQATADEPTDEVTAVEIEGISAEQQDLIQKMIDGKVKHLTDENKKVKADLKAEQTARLTAQFIEAAGEFTDFIPMSVEELGGLMMNISLKAPAEYVEMKKLLIAVKAGLADDKRFKAVGNDGPGETTGAVTAQIAALVKEKRTADPALTQEKAELLVLQENPELYTQERIELERR